MLPAAVLLELLHGVDGGGGGRGGDAECGGA
jgi:hypothetical protein